MTTSRVTRRNFLQGTAAVATAASLLPKIQLDAQTAHTEMWPENGTLIPDEGWRLWVDEKAEWKNDTISLPEDVSQGADGTVMGKGWQGYLEAVDRLIDIVEGTP